MVPSVTRGTSVPTTTRAPADDSDADSPTAGPAGAAAADAGAPAAQAGAADATSAAGAPTGGGAPAAGYTVVKGDSLWKIATGLKGSPGYAGMGVAQIVETMKSDNPQVTSGPKRKADGGLIYPGDVIKVRQGTQAPPSAPPQAGGTTPPQGWVNANTPARVNPTAAAAAGAAKVPGTPAEFLDAKFPTFLKALTSDPVSPALVDFVRNSLSQLKAASPELARTFKFQDLLNKADAADAKSKAITDNAKAVVVPGMLAKLNAGGVAPAEANEMVDQLKKIWVSVNGADQHALFDEVVQKLAQAGATNIGGQQPQQTDDASASAGGAPAGGPTEAHALIEKMLSTDKLPKDVQDKINRAMTLGKAGKVAEARALLVEAEANPATQEFLKAYGQ